MKITQINNRKVDENGYIEGEPLYKINPQNYKRREKGRKTRRKCERVKRYNYFIITNEQKQ